MILAFVLAAATASTPPTTDRANQKSEREIMERQLHNSQANSQQKQPTPGMSGGEAAVIYKQYQESLGKRLEVHPEDLNSKSL